MSDEQKQTTEVQPTQAVVVSQPASIARETPQTWFRGVPPEDRLNRMYGFAKAICNAAFISPIVRGDEASVFYLVSMAEDLGAQWTHGLRSIYPLVKRGKDGEGDQIRAGIQGDLALALLLGRKFKVKIVESTDEICKVWMQRPDGEMEFEDSFTVMEAQKANLLSKPNWNYRKDMLRWRAIMRVGRVVGADVLGGMYLPDEIENLDEPTRREPEQNPFSVTDSKQAPPAAQTSAETPKQEAPTPTAEVKTEAPTEKSKLDKPETPSPEVEKQAVAVETKDDKPRGRGKAKAEPKLEPAETPKTGFVATDDDLPPALTQPTAHVEPSERIAKVTDMPAPVKTQQERMEVLMVRQAKEAKTTEGIARAQIITFLRAFLNVAKIPKFPDAAYEPIIPLLESIVAQYSGRLAAAPGPLGKEVGEGWSKFVNFTSAWPEQAKAVATATCLERFCDDPGMFQDCIDTFAESATGADDLENVVAFLRMYRIDIGAMAIREIKTPAAELLESWGPITTKEELLTKLAEAEKIQAGQTEQPELWGEPK